MHNIIESINAQCYKVIFKSFKRRYGTGLKIICKYHGKLGMPLKFKYETTWLENDIIKGLNYIHSQIKNSLP